MEPLMSFIEWREHYIAKRKKGKKNELGSSQTSREIGATNDQGQALRNDSKIQPEGVHVFSLPEQQGHRRHH